MIGLTASMMVSEGKCFTRLFRLVRMSKTESETAKRESMGKNENVGQGDKVAN